VLSSAVYVGVVTPFCDLPCVVWGPMVVWGPEPQHFDLHVRPALAVDDIGQDRPNRVDRGADAEESARKLCIEAVEICEEERVTLASREISEKEANIFT
jgi:hypothetical protein